MAKFTIQEQIEAVIEVINDGAHKSDHDEKLDAVVTTLMYLRDHRPEIELAAMIYKDEAVKSVLSAFPGAKIDAIRTIVRYDGDLITED